MNRAFLTLPASAALCALAVLAFTSAPTHAPNLIELGLDAERRGGLAEAERHLLAAEQLDHLYTPRWTLAGFYFRHDRREDFWKWTRAALAVGTRDLGALFDLCWRADPGARPLPDRKAIWIEYLSYSLDTKHWDAATDTALRLSPDASQDDTPALLAYCDLAIEHGLARPAVPVWNALCNRRLIPASAREAGHFVTDPYFRQPPFGRGFGWRTSQASGVRQQWSPGRMQLVFSGLQPERCTLLSQALALEPGANYKVLFWNEADLAGVSLRVESEGRTIASTTGGRQLYLRFQAPAGAATLNLIYERAPGAVRSTGTFSLSSVDLVRE